MFERFTDRARRVVVLAQEEARLLNHSYIGTEHLLLGLLHEGDGIAARALESLGISLVTIRAQVEEIIGRGEASPTGHIPITPRAKKVLELSLREALQLGHNYIGTEHILLGLIREGEGVAAQVLVKLGADLSRVQDEVARQLSRGTHHTPRRTQPIGLGRSLSQVVPKLHRVVALGPDHQVNLPGGGVLVLLSLEVWSNALELRYALTGPPNPAAATLGEWTLTDDADRTYQRASITTTYDPLLATGTHRYQPWTLTQHEGVNHLVFAAPGDGPRLEIPLGSEGLSRGA
jgi:hypothetical protein